MIQVVAFALFVQLGGGLDAWLLRRPWYFPLLPLAMAAAVWWNSPADRTGPGGRGIGRDAGVRECGPGGGDAAGFV